MALGIAIRHMSTELKISLGQCSDRGRKEVNQDFHGALIPDGDARASKGISVVIADGISSSAVSQVAAETAIKSFLTDYYCTSPSWTVKTAGSRVIAAINAWLYAQNQSGQARYDRDRGYVCTFSALVLQSTTAHVLHIGDARIYRVAGASLDQLTTDHRMTVSSSESYLGRALGVNRSIEIDYLKIPVATGDVFVLATDGVYTHVEPPQLARIISSERDDLDAAARAIVACALEAGSTDNLTVQIVRVDETPVGGSDEAMDQSADLPSAPLLEARMTFEGFRILRTLHASSRSHLYLAEDLDSGRQAVIKVPSVDLGDDGAYLKRFMMEEWVARRISSAHVLRPFEPARKYSRKFRYCVMEYIEGKTLAQWMVDNPRPELDAARDIIEQIAKGLRAFHRMEMLHQDVRPENIMIDRTGTVRIIDFGSVKIAGVMEAAPTAAHGDMLGTAQYTAPEYLLGDIGSDRSDFYGVGVIAYQMLTGQLPYGAKMAQARSRSQQARVAYIPATSINAAVPNWIDGALCKAVNADPTKRYEALSEFTHDLRHPCDAFLVTRTAPLLERNPVRVWQFVSLFFLAVVIAQAMFR